MSLMLMAQAFGVQVGNASRKLVLLKLADHANDQGECWPSYQYIADQCEMSKRSAMRHIESLCAEGLIERRTRKGPKGNSTNVYLIALGSDNLSPPSESVTPPGDTMSPHSDTVSPPPSDTVSPGISHSFESVSEPVTEPKDSVGKPDIAAEAIAYLNQKAGRNFRVVPSSTKLIRARAKEGATLREIMAVIDRKCGEWLGDRNREQYLRPATLFNAEKFNNYLGQIGTPVPAGGTHDENKTSWPGSGNGGDELTRQLTDLEYARENF